MMRYLLLGAVSFVSAFSYGQSNKFTFKLGAEYELPRKSEDLSFFGNDKDGIVNLSLKKEELTILRFDPKSLSQSSDKVIPLEDATRNLNSETVLDFGTNYFWLHSDWDKSGGKEILYCDKIDVSSGKIVDGNRKLIETTRIAGLSTNNGFFNIKTTQKYSYDYDADHKKVLVTYRLWPEEKKDKLNYDKIGFYVFDENMTKLWGGEFSMPYTEAIMDNSDFSMDSQGNGYILAKVYDSEKRKEKDKETGMPAYHFEVLKFTKDSKKVITSSISIDDNFIRETTLIESALHEMLIACTYSKKSKGKGTDGIFLAQLDASGKVVKYKNGYYEFPLEELTKFESARSKRRMEKKDDYEAPNIKVRSVDVLSDGSVFIACEEFYVVEHYNNNNRGIGGFGGVGIGLGSSNYTYTFYYEDILAAKISATGQFEWLRKIPKKQRSGSRDSYQKKNPYRGTMGFKLISDASGFYFLYLDNKKNMEMEDDDVAKYHQDGFGGQVVVAKLDPKGLLTKALLFDTREEDVMLFPANFTRINNTQFVGRARVKKNIFQPLLITVK
ncbi:MAG: hypothetical protein H7258_15260 [Ferruginibacter sp.]|nr:hypothetical protein [Ferruginibacter sp.]